MGNVKGGRSEQHGHHIAALIERIEAADGTLIEQLLDRAGTASSLLELESLIAP